jgi:hypothetical protein
MDLYKKAHYDLDELKTLIKNPKTCIITKSSEKTAQELGFITSRRGCVAVRGKQISPFTRFQGHCPIALTLKFTCITPI